MEKFTTQQIKNALVELHKMKSEDAFRAYRMAFEELHKRLGDDAFDAFLEASGI